MNYFWVYMSVFIPPIPSSLSGTEICKNGVFEIFFVVIKQTALCIRLIVSFDVYFIVLYVPVYAGLVVSIK
jgi:hypothetical protein